MLPIQLSCDTTLDTCASDCQDVDQPRSLFQKTNHQNVIILFGIISLSNCAGSDWLLAASLEGIWHRSQCPYHSHRCAFPHHSQHDTQCPPVFVIIPMGLLLLLYTCGHSKLCHDLCYGAIAFMPRPPSVQATDLDAPQVKHDLSNCKHSRVALIPLSNVSYAIVSDTMVTRWGQVC